jgi:hypothetical protein
MNCIRAGLNCAHVLKCRPSTALKHGGLTSGRADPDPAQTLLRRHRVVVRGGRGRTRGQVGRRRSGDGLAAARGWDHGRALRAYAPGGARPASVRDRNRRRHRKSRRVLGRGRGRGRAAATETERRNERRTSGGRRALPNPKPRAAATATGTTDAKYRAR